MFYFHPFFFKIKDPFDGSSFLMCSHDPFFGTNKNRILKKDLVNRPTQRITDMLSSNHNLSLYTKLMTVPNKEDWQSMK